jgi:hypothetical protein
MPRITYVHYWGILGMYFIITGNGNSHNLEIELEGDGDFDIYENARVISYLQANEVSIGLTPK